MRKTLLMMVIEDEMKIDISSHLRRRFKAGWTQKAIAAELGVSPACISKWATEMKYAVRRVAARAWEEDNVPETVLADRAEQRRSRIHRIA